MTALQGYTAIRGIYRAYMRERSINLWHLARRLNGAWCARGQSPRFNWRTRNAIQRFASAQRSLGPECQKVLDDNRWDLYARPDPADLPRCWPFERGIARPPVHRVD